MVNKTDSNTNLSKPGLLVTVIIILVTLVLSVIFNIPLVRQIVGYVFLTFIPGWLIMCIFQLDAQSIMEKVLICVGLSITFTMFTGLLINSIYPLFGYKTPLTTYTLLISFIIIIIILAIIAVFKNKAVNLLNTSSLCLDARERIFTSSLLFFHY